MLADIQAITGVPQGSILDPLLFSLYINDIAEKLGIHIIFTDDAKIYLHIYSVKEYN